MHGIFAASLVVVACLGDPVRGVVGEGSCAAARKCCDGKDTDCAVTHDVNFLSSAPCYCDHGCLDWGDCCSDFKDYCGVLDCRVSEWGAWSSCDGECGRGISRRSRTVLHPAANGGAECGDLEQRRTCRGRESCSQRAKDKISALGETAMLLPGKYSTNRAIASTKWDVRSNLKSYVEEENKDEYCVMFRVDKAMKACMISKDTRPLHRGNEVCVACESKAVRENLGDRCTGHGVLNKQTRFKNVISTGCHGRWERVRVESGQCPCKAGPHFIFV